LLPQQSSLFKKGRLIYLVTETKRYVGASKHLVGTISRREIAPSHFFKPYSYTEKWFCYSNKIRDNNNFFVAATKNFAAATKRFVDRTKHFVVVTKCFCYPYFNK